MKRQRSSQSARFQMHVLREKRRRIETSRILNQNNSLPGQNYVASTSSDGFNNQTSEIDISPYHIRESNIKKLETPCFSLNNKKPVDSTQNSQLAPLTFDKPSNPLLNLPHFSRISPIVSCMSTNGLNEPLKISLAESLANWAVHENIKLCSLKTLLGILRQDFPAAEFKNLPKDPRTLLHTPKTQIETLGNGYYHYFGIAETIKCLCQKSCDKLTSNDKILLSVNLDGVPLFKSTG